MAKMTLTYVGKVLPLVRTVVMGRHRENQIRVNDVAASRHHAVIEVADDQAWLEDLGSANGTRINGLKVTERQQLKPGDRIGIGKFEIVFGHGDDPAPGKPPAGEPAEKSAEASAGSTTTDTTKRLDDLIGHQLAGHRISRLLIQDAFSALFVGKQINLGRSVVLRIFRPEVVERIAGIADKALDVAKRTGRLEHRHLGQMHECGVTDGLLWYSMEYIEGRCLEDIVKQDGPLEAEAALVILERMASAIGTAHAQEVFHGDIRPRSIMIDDSGVVKVTNFGMAPVQSELQRGLGAGAGIGSPLYCAPELADGAELDPRTDLYSLGCTFYFALTGETPFDGATPQAIFNAHRQRPIPNPCIARPDLPASFNKLLQGMLAKNREWRYHDMDELLAEIDTVRREHAAASVRAPVSSAVPAPVRPRSGRQRTGGSTRATVPTNGSDPGSNLIKLGIVALVLAAILVLLPFVKGYLRAGNEVGPLPSQPAADPEWREHGRHFEFDDPTELDQWEVSIGDTRLRDGRLSAPPGEPAVLRCRYPFGGPNWLVALRCRLAALPEKEALFSLDVTENQQSLIMLDLAGDTLTVTVKRAGGDDETRKVIMTADDLADLPISIRCRNGTASVSIHGRILVPRVRLPEVRSARVGINCSAITWDLADLAITGRAR